jgi:hypothetical protein
MRPTSLSTGGGSVSDFATYQELPAYSGSNILTGLLAIRPIGPNFVLSFCRHVAKLEQQSRANLMSNTEETQPTAFQEQKTGETTGAFGFTPSHSTRRDWGGR